MLKQAEVRFLLLLGLVAKEHTHLGAVALEMPQGDAVHDINVAHDGGDDVDAYAGSGAQLLQDILERVCAAHHQVAVLARADRKLVHHFLIRERLNRGRVKEDGLHVVQVQQRLHAFVCKSVHQDAALGVVDGLRHVRQRHAVGELRRRVHDVADLVGHEHVDSPCVRMQLRQRLRAAYDAGRFPPHVLEVVITRPEAGQARLGELSLQVVKRGIDQARLWRCPDKARPRPVVALVLLHQPAEIEPHLVRLAAGHCLARNDDPRVTVLLQPLLPQVLSRSVPHVFRDGRHALFAIWVDYVVTNQPWHREERRRDEADERFAAVRLVAAAAQVLHVVGASAGRHPAGIATLQCRAVAALRAVAMQHHAVVSVKEQPA